jgi:hypothetical protein
MRHSLNVVWFMLLLYFFLGALEIGVKPVPNVTGFRFSVVSAYGIAWASQNQGQKNIEWFRKQLGISPK